MAAWKWLAMRESDSSGISLVDSQVAQSKTDDDKSKRKGRGKSGVSA